MCIIVDTNMTGDYQKKPAYLQPVLRYFLGGGKITINPALIQEYPEKFIATIAELNKNGQVKLYGDATPSEKIKKLMVSDDPHIIALVRESGTRVVCTKDKSLMVDLKNPNIVNRPRCKVYKHKGAASVLDGCCS